MTYRKVDRSHFTPNVDGHMGDDVVDIGWAEGVLQDGRPYQMECWSAAGTTGVTVFMASDGLEAGDTLPVHTLLEESGVITTILPQELSLRYFVDPAGTACLSISYVVADEDDEYFVVAHPPLHMYRGDNASMYESSGEMLLDPDPGEADEFITQETLDLLDALFDEAMAPKARSPMAEARRAAKALAKLQPKEKRPKRRKFRKPQQ